SGRSPWLMRKGDPSRSDWQETSVVCPSLFYDDRVEKLYSSEIEKDAASRKALFFLQSRSWLGACRFHASSRGTRGRRCQDSGEEGEATMRDWMAFATAAVVALLTKMLLA